MKGYMMQTIHFDCQGCSNHCPLTVYAENNEIQEVQGNCCHRGLVSARTQFSQMKVAASSPTGTRDMFCTGCPNNCALTVHLTDGEPVSIEGNGCRRASVSVTRQLKRERSRL